MPIDIPTSSDLSLVSRSTPEQEAAAGRAVLRRYERGLLDAAETRDALAMLGLIAYEGAGQSSRKAPRASHRRAAS